MKLFKNLLTVSLSIFILFFISVSRKKQLRSQLILRPINSLHKRKQEQLNRAKKKFLFDRKIVEHFVKLFIFGILNLWLNFFIGSIILFQDFLARFSKWFDSDFTSKFSFNDEKWFYENADTA